MLKNKNVTNGLIGLVLLLVFNSCDLNNDVANEINEHIYILSDKDYEIICGNTEIDENRNILYPAKCAIEIINFNKYHSKILNTSKYQWINLLKSNNEEVARSASIWLYFLSKEKLDLVNLKLNKLDLQQKNQVEFWKSYFAKGCEVNCPPDI